MEDLFKRYIWLFNTIYEAGEITFEDINQQWINRGNGEVDPIPKKTFHTHKDKVMELFDINIKCKKRGREYYYYIEDVSILDETNHQLINTYYLQQLAKESVKIKDRVLVELTPSKSNALFTITDAMLESRALDIEYKSYYAEYPKTLQIEPYILKHFKQRWYLLGRDVEKNRLKTYALDRILSCKRRTQYFEMSKDFNPQEYFRYNYGIIVNADEYDVETVEIKAYGKQSEYIRSLPLHHSQVEIKQNEDYTLFSYKIRPSYDFNQEILAHGSSIEVVSPAWYRDEIKNAFKAALSRYE